MFCHIKLYEACRPPVLYQTSWLHGYLILLVVFRLVQDFRGSACSTMSFIRYFKLIYFGRMKYNLVGCQSEIRNHSESNQCN